MSKKEAQINFPDVMIAWGGIPINHICLRCGYTPNGQQLGATAPFRPDCFVSQQPEGPKWSLVAKADTFLGLSCRFSP